MTAQVTQDETRAAGIGAIVSTIVFFGCSFADLHLLLSSVAAISSGAFLFLLIRWIRSIVQ